MNFQRLICFVLFYLITSIVNGQNLQSLMLEGQDLLTKGKYDEAIKSFNLAKNILDNEKKSNTVLYGKLLLGILSGSIKQQDTLGAENKFLEIEKIYLVDSSNTLYDQYELLKTKIDYYIAWEKYEDVEKLSNKFLQYSKSINANENDYLYYDFLYYLCVTKYQVGLKREGELLFTQLIEFRKKQTSIKDRQKLTGIYTHFANFLQESRRIQKAEENYLEAYKISATLISENEIMHLYVLEKITAFYRNFGKYSSAIVFCKEGLLIEQKEKGENSAEFAGWTKTLGTLFEMNNDLDSAEYYLEKTLSINSKLYGTDNESYAMVLLLKARVVIKKNNPKEAEKYISKSIAIFKKRANMMNLASLNLAYGMQANIFEEAGEILKSEEMRLESLKSVSQNLKPSNKLVLNTMLSLATFYAKIGKLQPCDSLFKIILLTGSSLNDSLSLAFYLTQYANILKTFGKYDEAQAAFERALIINDSNIGINSDDHFNIALQLAEIYRLSNPLKRDEIMNNLKNQLRDDFSKINDKYTLSLILTLFAEYNFEKQNYITAELYYKKVVEINSTLTPYFQAFSLCSLGYFYIDIGNFQKAEDIYLQAKDILSKNNEDVSLAALPLALQYFNDYRFEKCLMLYEECIRFLERKRIQSPSLAKLYIKKAEIEDEIQKLNEAEKNYNKGLTIYENNGYSNTNDYYFSLQSFAHFNQNLGRLEKADSLYRKILLFYQSTGNKKEYATLLFSYGLRLGYKNEEVKDSIYQKSIKLLVEYMGEDNSDLRVYYSSIANFYLFTAQEKAEFFLKKELNLLKKDIARQFEYLSVGEKIAYLQNISKDLFANFSSIFREASFRSKITPFLYDKLLLFKSAVLKNNIAFQNEIYRSTDSHIKGLWQNYLVAKKKVAQQYKLPSDKRTLIQSENDAEKIEKELFKKVSGLASFKNSFNVEWKNVQSSLKANEAAIEFVAFTYHRTNWSDSVLYVALLIRPGYIYPKYVFLFEEKQLFSIIQKSNGELDQAYINNLYKLKDGNNPLARLIWDPLDSLLQGVTTLYVSPSGLLHKIALGAIPTNDGNTISSKYGLQILGTTGDIVNKKDDFIDKKSVEEAIVFGGINYDVASTKPVDFNSTAPNNIYAYVPTDSTRGANGKWNYLGGSLNEAQEISKEFKDQKITTHFYSDSTATETLFKNMPVSSNSIIHIATHGYFFPDLKRKKEDNMMMINEEKQTAFKASENPLLRSGLIFAGANPTWTNPDYVSTATDDGILTAYEISNMDLSNVKLVVLSACETGLGDIKGSEGVFGLQRSFKLAGVKNIIMSLWKVPDEKTRELMQTFYQFCFKGKSVSEAFKAAQDTMKIKYPASPYYWAGFTLLQ